MINYRFIIKSEIPFIWKSTSPESHQINKEWIRQTSLDPQDPSDIQLRGLTEWWI